MKKILTLVAVLLCTAAVASAETKGEFGNWCAMALAKGNKVATECKISWTDDKTHKTYCFANEEMKKEWAANIAANMKNAETHYATLNPHAAAGHGTNKM